MNYNTHPEIFKEHPAWLRLEDQLDWYDRKSRSNQTWYKVLKLTQIVLATSIPLFALSKESWAQGAMAILGAMIAILEAVQHLYQFNTLWIEYRATAESLKHEKYLFLAKAGPYRGLNIEEALALLAERVEEQVSKEHAQWVRGSKGKEEQKR